GVRGVEDGEGSSELGEPRGGLEVDDQLLQNGLLIIPRRDGDLQPRRRRHRLPAPLHCLRRDPPKNAHIANPKVFHPFPLSPPFLMVQFFMP
ncbi:hypothetical protein GW17_00002498, partial [Ensete ventricosum]